VHHSSDGNGPYGLKAPHGSEVELRLRNRIKIEVLRMSSNTYQVRFITQPDPRHPGGFIMRYEQVGDIAHVDSPLKVVFEDEVKLAVAFLNAGICLHSFGQADPERDVKPDPEQSYEVTNDTLRKLGFDISDNRYV
jgi:hypothetical protein